MTPLQKILISSAVFWPAMFYIALHINEGNVYVLTGIGALLGGLFGFYHSKLIEEAKKYAG